MNLMLLCNVKNNRLVIFTDEIKGHCIMADETEESSCDYRTLNFVIRFLYAFDAQPIE